MTMKKNAGAEKGYHPKEKLVIEVDSRCANLAVGGHLVRSGKTRLEILAEDLCRFTQLVEEEQAALKKAEARVASEIEKLKEANWKLEPEQLERLIGDYTVQNSGPSVFRKAEGRDPKPLNSVEVLESKGIVDTEAAKEHSDEKVARLLAILLEKFEGKK